MAKDIFEQYINDIKHNHVLTYEEERDLKNRILAGSEEAKIELYNRHLKFVVSVAKSYKNSFLDINDLISEGNYGMLVALDKFDYSKDVRFMTYAIYWVRHYINTALTNDSRTIRYPSNIVHNKDNEIQSCVSISLLSNSDEDQNEEYNEDIANTSSAFIIETEEGIDKEAISEVLKTLSERESDIMVLYYGLDGFGPRNLSEIGTLLGITKERVRQIKVTALRKIKSNISELNKSVFG